MNNIQILPSVALLCLSALFSAHTYSHARWDPAGLVPPRSTTDANKTGPCGAPRTDNPTLLPAGATLTVEFESTIYHQGDFRIAFSPADDAGFDDYVLAEAILDERDRHNRSAEITLPDIECTRCTLQLIQVMRDSTPSTNYYSCADIQLTREAEHDTEAPRSISLLTAMPGDGEALLNWSRPVDDDYAGVLFLYSENPLVATPTAGEMYRLGQRLGDARVVYSGNAESATVNDLPAGSTAFFAGFAFDSHFNYAEAVSTMVELSDTVPNFAPEVELQWVQAGNDAGTASTSGGEVIISAQVSDANPDDQHSFAWQALDTQLSDNDNLAHQFTFDPTGLPSGLYEFQVNVSDDGEPSLSSSASVFIELAPEARAGAGSGLWLCIALMGLLILRKPR